MKRITALVIALLMLCLMVPTAAMAEEEKPFWVTHFNDSASEGAGAIFTQPYQNAGWWLHFAFAPTDVEGVYQIVDSSNGLGDGLALPLEIPEGGFVWAANYGNDYIALGIGDTDFTSPSCTNCIDDVVASWMTGTLVKFNGLDLEALTVPTSTPGTLWYDDAYVCTATYSIYEGDANVTVPGDDESSAPADDSSAEASDDASADASSEAESSAAESSEASNASSAASEDESSSADDAEGGLGTGAIIAIIVAAVVVVAVIVVVATKKKKQ